MPSANENSRTACGGSHYEVTVVIEPDGTTHTTVQEVADPPCDNDGGGTGGGSGGGIGGGSPGGPIGVPIGGGGGGDGGSGDPDGGGGTVGIAPLIPQNPQNGDLVSFDTYDGRHFEFAYDIELDAWVMPELIFALEESQVDVVLENPNLGGLPRFEGGFLTTMALPALAEPTPVGEILLAGTAIYLVGVFAVELVDYYRYYTPPPRILPGFPGARKVKPRTGRTRWKDTNGDILEWDGQHSEVEVYDKRGKHKHVTNPDGEIIKPGVPGRKVPT